MDLLFDLLREAIAPTTAAFALAAIGLNFHFGLTGLLNMGQAGFMLLGMYGYAITVREGGPIWLGIIVAIACAAVFGVILGWPTLKLRGDYLAIVTIAAAEMIRYLGRSQNLNDLTGASTGIRGNDFKGSFEELSPFPDSMVTIGPFTFHGTRSTSWWLVLVGWTLVGLMVLLYWRLSKSPWGRVLKGIREDEDAVRSLGKNVYSYKMQALVIGGVIGALAGIVWSLGASVQPDSMGRPTTFWVWTLLLLGGAATVFGPVLGSILFWCSLVLVKGLASAFIPTTVLSSQQLEPFSLALVGVTLMCLVIFRPQGVLGDKKELAFND
ncbi:branched-chain amino acid ABC transporter permease [Demequina pelophila]|uniref:branched-chain amino acid ABC transporter permease n=1 Tax=Demequina pelophila TaxID=1638984 RepID=UPI0007849EA9|nr:branched-chain amino acid ABC transporter permease [Demequina pelophila]